MKIKKRNNEIVAYDGEKIVFAIQNAMHDLEYMEDVNNPESKEIENVVKALIESSNKDWTVEEVSDEVEMQLMEFGLGKIAKEYILFRQKKSLSRDDRDIRQYKLLSKDFLSKYKHIESPMGNLGSFVYYRTYSRWIPEQKRREDWWETVARAVDYNCGLVGTSVEEAEKLYDNIFTLKQFLSGRTFWVGGTDVAKHYKTSNFNCASLIINKFENYKDLFYLLMVGSGVGFRILKSDVAKLPKVRTDIMIQHEHYDPVEKKARVDSTSLEFTGSNMVKIIVGDSKEGWTQSLDYLLKLHYSHEYRLIKYISINYNNVRPHGERLKSFGGTASGHESMVNMLRKISLVLSSRKNGIMKTIDCMDIANIIGENVVVGGRLKKIA